MKEHAGKIECEIELDRASVEFIDRLAATREGGRDAIIQEAVTMFIDRFRNWVGQQGQAKTKGSDSRTVHTVALPPKRDE